LYAVYSCDILISWLPSHSSTIPKCYVFKCTYVFLIIHWFNKTYCHLLFWFGGKLW